MKIGMLNIEKVRPFFVAPEATAYYGMGKLLGEAFSIGQDVKKEIKYRVLLYMILNQHNNCSCVQKRKGASPWTPNRLQGR
jgi:hypothetical protein